MIFKPWNRGFEGGKKGRRNCINIVWNETTESFRVESAGESLQTMQKILVHRKVGQRAFPSLRLRREAGVAEGAQISSDLGILLH